MVDFRNGSYKILRNGLSNFLDFKNKILLNYMVIFLNIKAFNILLRCNIINGHIKMEFRNKNFKINKVEIRNNYGIVDYCCYKLRNIFCYDFISYLITYSKKFILWNCNKIRISSKSGRDYSLLYNFFSWNRFNIL